MARRNVIRVVARNLPNPFSQILTRSRVWNRILQAYYAASLILFTSLLCFLIKTIFITTGKGCRDDTYYNRHHQTLQSQLYSSKYTSPGTMMLLWGAAIVGTALCCETASTLCCCEWGAHTAAQAWLSVGSMSRYGGVFSEKREKMRDRSHSQRLVPEWCCSAPCSTLSTPNEKFPDIQWGSSWEWKCFPTTAVSFFGQ